MKQNVLDQYFHLTSPFTSLSCAIILVLDQCLHLTEQPTFLCYNIKMAIYLRILWSDFEKNYKVHNYILDVSLTLIFMNIQLIF